MEAAGKAMTLAAKMNGCQARESNINIPASLPLSLLLSLTETNTHTLA
jgi:hypothetical protein